MDWIGSRFDYNNVNSPEIRNSFKGSYWYEMTVNPNITEKPELFGRLHSMPLKLNLSTLLLSCLVLSSFMFVLLARFFIVGVEFPETHTGYFDHIPGKDQLAPGKINDFEIKIPPIVFGLRYPWNFKIPEFRGNVCPCSFSSFLRSNSNFNAMQCE